MEYNKLISITGMSGLFEVISSKTDGAIVKNLEDGITKFVSSRVHNFSHLESIEVYTITDNVNLVEVLGAMQKSKEAKPDVKDAAAVKKYFEKVYKEMDFEKVYNSDMKKMVKWLDILEKNKVEIKLDEAGAEGAEEVKEIKEVKEVKPKATPKAAAIKKAPAQKITSPRKMA
jgi:biotin synthase-related radical SAM superfamily protein